MNADEIETVLANWIEQALSPIGQLPEGTAPASWIAARFMEWWRQSLREALNDIDGTVSNAERATEAVRKELILRLGGWESFGDALHELIHLRDALGELRGIMKLSQQTDAQPDVIQPDREGIIE